MIKRKTEMSSDQEELIQQIPEDETSIIEQEAGCDILLRKESIQLNSGDFASKRQLELLEGEDDADNDNNDDNDADNDDDDDEDDDEPDEGSASAINIPAIMSGYSRKDDNGDDDDDEGSYTILGGVYDDELLSSGKDVTIVDTTGDCNVMGKVCARNEYNSVNAKRMEDLWDEIGRDVYGMMQRVDLDDVVVNYNQHNFDMTGYVDGRLVSVVQHPIFTVIAPFD